jgi:hypothetical protein
MPEVTDFFATLQSPIRRSCCRSGQARVCGPQNGRDWLHIAALWSTAAAAVIGGLGVRALALRGFSKAQEAQGPIHAVAHPRSAGRLTAAVASAKHLLIKDLKVFCATSASGRSSCCCSRW